MAGKLTPGKPSKENHRIFPQPVKPLPQLESQQNRTFPQLQSHA
jgi:hypothetical protein